MKLTLSSVLLPILAVVSTAAAQGSNIGYPAPDTEVYKGEVLIVRIDRPIEMMGSTEVGIVLSFQYCGMSPCPSPVNELGEILYNGQYNPERHEPELPPYQNFTVTIPDFEFWEPGRARIVENRFHLIGGGPSAILETNFVNVQLGNINDGD